GRAWRRSQPRLVDDDARKRDPEQLLLRIRRADAELRDRMVSRLGQPRREQHLPARDVADAGRHGERRRAHVQLRDRRPVHPGRRRVDAAQLRRPQRRRRYAFDRGQRRPGGGNRQHPRHASLPDLLPQSLPRRPEQDGEHGDDAPLGVLPVLQHRWQRAGAARILHDIRDQPQHGRRRHLFVWTAGLGSVRRLADAGNRPTMGELRHRERELPLRRRGGPDRVDELREFRPGDPRAAALPLSVRQAELVGHSALARDRSGRRRRGHPRIWRAWRQDSRTPSDLRWGNYDTVSASFRFDAAEVPTGLTNFANSVPATHVLPPSLYLSAKPSWWGTVPWPAIGPDVAGGDIPGYGGHVYKIPARRCYENAAIDPAYGS